MGVINYYSPTVQQVMQQNFGNYMNPPYGQPDPYGGYSLQQQDPYQYNSYQGQPYGNIPQPDPYQYNGGGYGNYYGNPNYSALYNPYARRDQLRLQEEAAKKQLDMNVSFATALAKCAGAYFGTDVDEAQIRASLDPATYQTMADPKILERDRKQSYVNGIHSISMQQEQQNARMVQQLNDAQQFVTNDHNKFIPDNCGMIEYFQKAGQLYAEMKLRESRQNQKNLRPMYDSNNYRRMLGLNPTNDFARALSANIDDDTISLPSYIANNDYASARKAFFDSIANPGGVR